MKIAVYDIKGYAGYGDRVAAQDAAGYDTIVTDEAKADPFVRSAVAASRTSRAEIMTGIAVAFARTPMLLAYSAHDMNVISGGRFHLGLGSQVKAHITRRYAMPWTHPAPRMKEMIQAIHAIWDCWYEGKSLDFQGEYYRHTLMTPMFTPLELDLPRPKIHLGAVGPYMTRAAADVADGMITHSLTTPAYIRDVTIPMLEEGLGARGLAMKDFELSGVPFVATGETEEMLESEKLRIRKQIAFYCSTPSYRAVLDHQGWGALHEAALPMSKAGQWNAMTDLIDDEVPAAFAVVGTGREVVAQLRERFKGLYDRISVRFNAEAEEIPDLVAALKAD